MAIRTRQDAIPHQNNIQTTSLLRDVEAARRHHRLRRAAEQGDRRAQRLRARGRHPSGRRAEERRHLRDHDAGKRRLGEEQPGAGQAFRPRRVPRQAEDAGLQDRRQPAERRVPPLQGPGRPQEGGVRRGHRRAGRRRGDARPRAHPLRLARPACRVEGAAARRDGAGGGRRGEVGDRDRRRSGGCDVQGDPGRSSRTPRTSCCSRSAR